MKSNCHGITIDKNITMSYNLRVNRNQKRPAVTGRFGRIRG